MSELEYLVRPRGNERITLLAFVGFWHDGLRLIAATPTGKLLAADEVPPLSRHQNSIIELHRRRLVALLELPAWRGRPAILWRLQALRATLRAESGSERMITRITAILEAFPVHLLNPKGDPPPSLSGDTQSQSGWQDAA